VYLAGFVEKSTPLKLKGGRGGIREGATRVSTASHGTLLLNACMRYVCTWCLVRVVEFLVVCENVFDVVVPELAPELHIRDGEVSLRVVEVFERGVESGELALDALARRLVRGTGQGSVLERVDQLLHVGRLQRTGHWKKKTEGGDGSRREAHK